MSSIEITEFEFALHIVHARNFLGESIIMYLLQCSIFSDVYRMLYLRNDERCRIYNAGSFSLQIESYKTVCLFS